MHNIDAYSQISKSLRRLILISVKFNYIKFKFDY